VQSCRRLFPVVVAGQHAEAIDGVQRRYTGTATGTCIQRLEALRGLKAAHRDQRGQFL
jgi:hypothetical protein